VLLFLSFFNINTRRWLRDILSGLRGDAVRFSFHSVVDLGHHGPGVVVLGCVLSGPGLADSVCDKGSDSVPAPPASSVDSEDLTQCSVGR